MVNLINILRVLLTAWNTEGGKYHCTVVLLFDWFGIRCMTTDNFFYLQNRLTQTSQTGGQQYSDTSPFSIPWHRPWVSTELFAKIVIFDLIKIP